MAIEPFFNNKAKDGSVASDAIPHSVVVLVDAFHGTHAVDMTRNDMTAETSTSEHRAPRFTGLPGAAHPKTNGSEFRA